MFPGKKGAFFVFTIFLYDAAFTSCARLKFPQKEAAARPYTAFQFVGLGPRVASARRFGFFNFSPKPLDLEPRSKRRSKGRAPIRRRIPIAQAPPSNASGAIAV